MEGESKGSRGASGASNRSPGGEFKLMGDLNNFVEGPDSPTNVTAAAAVAAAGKKKAKKGAVVKESPLRAGLTSAVEDPVPGVKLTTDQQFKAWLSRVELDEHGDLRASLLGFMRESHAPLEELASFLEAATATRANRSRPVIAVHEELRRCLESLVQEREADDAAGERETFTAWTVDQSLPSPAASAVSTAEREESCDAFAEPRISPRTALAAAQARADEAAAQAKAEALEARARQRAAYEQSFASAQAAAKAFQLPDRPDAAAEEAAARWSSEDRDFVTPWYTYVIRMLMPPLGVLIFYFIFWRVYNYPRSGIWWSDACAWTFIVCEAICYLFAMTHWVWIWNLKFRKRVTTQELNLREEDLPTVDIMIPCYSEPTEIVEMTLKACYDMDYPAHKITCWVCDDGKKEDMKNMVELVGSQNKGKTKTRYVARTKIPGVPHHAKAGNLNNCILKEGSSGQLIIILDCDMLPEPCMARTVAPFFFKKLPLRDGRERQGPADLEDGRDVQRAQFDNETGLLQTPQAFYNLDTNDLLGQSYAFFYECLMSGWDGTSCTPCCGTGVTFNRYALEKVGGFSTGSITEDFKTSLNLCANGFKCKYFLQRMTRGVSPKELNAFMVQRLRWAVGAIQIVLAGNPLFISGLHFRARWLYFFSTVGIVYIIPVVVMGCIMYGTILAGAPISFGPTSFEQYLIIGFTANVLMMLMQYLAGWRLSSRDYLRALQDNFTVFMTLIRAILIGFCGMEMGFAVTNKDVSFDLRANLHHAAPHLFVYVFSGTAMVKGVIECLSSYGLFSIPWTTNYNVSLIYFSLMWTIFIWVMVSGPPRMVLYGYLRARREARSAIQCTNGNVPALQELPSTPMNTFPPLTPELWVKPMLTYGQPPTPKTTGALSAGVASPGSDVENAVSERDAASTVVASH